MTENKLSIEKTIRYFTIGDIEKAKYLLIALHGYGQLSSYFGKKFEDLPNEFFIVIPEGMHRFYLDGTSGRVGASWMTKEAREDDIEDNLNYLNQLIKMLTSNKSFEKIILLGFSQGGATATRYYYSNSKIDHLVLWACIFPPDLKIENEVKKENQSNVFVLGNQDSYFAGNQFSETLNFYSKLGFKTIEYSGNHSIDSTILKNLMNSLI
jgi:predicted esterase